jgi:hypothetical protein
VQVEEEQSAYSFSAFIKKRDVVRTKLNDTSYADDTQTSCIFP